MEGCRVCWFSGCYISCFADAFIQSDLQLIRLSRGQSPLEQYGVKGPTAVRILLWPHLGLNHQRSGSQSCSTRLQAALHLNHQRSGSQSCSTRLQAALHLNHQRSGSQSCSTRLQAALHLNHQRSGSQSCSTRLQAALHHVVLLFSPWLHLSRWVPK